MSKVYKVIWSEIAEDDLINIISYFAQDNAVNARGVFEKIKASAAKLDELPERGRFVPELQAQGVFLYKELIILPWRLIYRVTDDEVLVLSVIDSRRNVEDLLLARLM